MKKQRPLSEIIKELSDYIDQSSSECPEFIRDPSALVGRCITHKFETDDTGEIKWYSGTVLHYDMATKTHEIMYEGEEEYCYFDLTLDILNGDLKVLGEGQGEGEITARESR